MLGKRSDQRGLWEADRLYLDYVGKDTFYGLLASLRGQLFSDDDFAEIYGPDNGRDSVPPSLLATALLLQTYDKVSDAEAKARADFDIRWKVALGIEIEDRPFAKSTLQMFRAQLILHEKVREVFEGSLRLARQSGYLKKRGMRVALDTTYILGRGAVKDTYNLLADGIVKLLRALAAVANATLPAWAEAQGYQRYFGSSIKGEAAIDWSDRKARAALLAELVADADRLLGFRLLLVYRQVSFRIGRQKHIDVGCDLQCHRSCTRNSRFSRFLGTWGRGGGSDWQEQPCSRFSAWSRDRSAWRRFVADMLAIIAIPMQPNKAASAMV